MTGFGQAEARTSSGVFRMEIRAVNNRYLDIQMRQPRSFANLEPKVKKDITDAISRGSISVFITWDREEGEARLTWDGKAVDDYIRIFREIKKKYKLAGEVSISDLLHFSDFIKSEASLFEEKTLWKHFRPVLSEALADLQKSREAEGDHIIRDLKKMLSDMAALLGKIEVRAPQRVAEYAEELKKRIDKLIKNPPDEQRLAMEIAIMADKMDISEECTRLRAHIGALMKDCDSDEPVGKRINFLLQEMNREANTIGSKANDTGISHLSITLKEIIEKMREQIQNIE
jgi:uncharacterized protein (TIGR00255 family)